MIGLTKVDPSFLQLCTITRVRHISSPLSNHCLVVANIKRVDEGEGRAPHKFMYEEVWQCEDSYEAVVLDGWEKAKGIICLLDLSIIHLQPHLTNLKVKKFGDIRRKLRKVRKEFERKKMNSLYPGSSTSERELARQLNVLLQNEEIMARKQSGVDWLHAGD